VVYFSDGEGAQIVEQLGLGFVIKNNFISEFEQLLIDIQADQGKVAKFKLHTRNSKKAF
jgi:hypothetical protein